MATEDPKLHVLILPYFTPSHIMPLVEIGRLIAARGGVNITIITTPHNANLFRSSVDQDINSGHQISIHELKFPSTEVGLPEGIENFSAITSTDMSAKVFEGIMRLRKPMEDLIRNLSPDCIFSDMFYPWTVELAEELKIPRLMFYLSSFFYCCLKHSLKLYAPHDKVQSDTESFLIPHLPDTIEMKRSQLEDYVKGKSRLGVLINAINDSGLKTYGIVHPTFYELEPAYADHYIKIKPAKFWGILPLFQFFKELKAPRSNDSQHNCLSWLDSQKPNSVVLLCFGSMVRFPDAQLTEIALALEVSTHPFIWAVRKSEESREESWLPAGFEKRMMEGNKGMIVRGWAPQVKILAHPATGAFMTHCGWNSVLEAVAAGVPLITWPLFAEQFWNEKLIEVLKIGVGVGAEVWNPTFEITCPPVGRDKIEKAFSKLMGGSEESQKIRQKVKEMAAMAKGAVEEGGSSYNNITALIEDLKACAFEK
nr:UDP-glycosyltransferases UGT73CB5 [Aralia elata]